MIQKVLITECDTGLNYEQLIHRMMVSEEKLKCGSWWVAETEMARWLRAALLLEEDE